MAILKPTLSDDSAMTNLTATVEGDADATATSVYTFAKSLSNLMETLRQEKQAVENPAAISQPEAITPDTALPDRPQYYTDEDATEKTKAVTPTSGRVLTVTDTSLPVEAKAFLDTIARYESPGYDVIVGQGAYGAPAKFTDYTKHPNVIGMRTVAGPSTAAGRYQFVNKTWRALQQQYPGQFTDFTPLTQDRAAWRYAQDVYKQRTGRDLLTTLKAGNIQDVKQRLANIWIGFGLDRDVIGTYTQSLRRYQM
jgi:muramidase (phage lysozyme)